MRIAIIIKNLNKLTNYELRLANRIKMDSSFELCLLIHDGRKNSNGINTKNTISKSLLKLQLQLESKIYKSSFIANKQEIIDYLKATPSISFHPTKKGHQDIFSKEDADKITPYDLDIILNLEFDSIQGEILKTTKHGI
ncbi:hypothetical protein DFR65_105109 [Oceanihabitans sediminis]|uniref:Uncharacterized protein n=1 Tax=Oceanihabitans sediminis TaxID=1812012 RepID=A0A368P4L1_9FLAO|nr:hypothetical protein [Oceanihabitans sediminis]RBP29883.1 hypothetical protein DFR65_105109 [Oceanihabitans sediminis]RCU57220.1 hypothetical protein DU428_09770 [Oceanihabitans sediminis]